MLTGEVFPASDGTIFNRQAHMVLHEANLDLGRSFWDLLEKARAFCGKPIFDKPATMDDLLELLTYMLQDPAAVEVMIEKARASNLAAAAVADAEQEPAKPDLTWGDPMVAVQQELSLSYDPAAPETNQAVKVLMAEAEDGSVVSFADLSPPEPPTFEDTQVVEEEEPPPPPSDDEEIPPPPPDDETPPPPPWDDDPPPPPP